MKSNQYFMSGELLNELIPQNIIILDQKWHEDRSEFCWVNTSSVENLIYDGWLVTTAENEW